MLRCYLVEEKLAKVRNNKPDDLDKEYFSSHRLLHFSPVTLHVDLVAKFHFQLELKREEEARKASKLERSTSAC